MYVSTCNNEIDNHGHVSTIIILTLISVVTLVKLTNNIKESTMYFIKSQVFVYLVHVHRTYNVFKTTDWSQYVTY